MECGEKPESKNLKNCFTMRLLESLAKITILWNTVYLLNHKSERHNMIDYLVIKI